jgi:hypothetical protein
MEQQGIKSAEKVTAILPITFLARADVAIIKSSFKSVHLAKAFISQERSSRQIA